MTLVYTGTTGAMSGKTSLAEGLATAEMDRLYAKVAELLARDDMVGVMAKARAAAKAAEVSLGYAAGRQFGKTETSLAHYMAHPPKPLRARGWKWRR